MLENKETENLEAIVIKIDEQNFTKTTMRADALSKMSHLKLLILENVNFSGSLNHLSNELGYLQWKLYPFKCLPPSFQLDKLVELNLPHSSIKQLWEGVKPLYNLRRMDLSHSKSLIEIPDFREVPNLEFLNLEGCIKLVRINRSIGTLRKLVDMNLMNCKNLVSIPSSIFYLSSLKDLNLSGCSKLLRNNLSEKPRDAEHLEKFEIFEGSKQQSSSSIYKFLKFPIHFRYSRRHEDSVCSLLPYLPHFPCLQFLDLSFCNLLQIPDAIGWLHSLEKLNLGGNHFVTLPSSIKELTKLKMLKLEYCKELRYLPELPFNQSKTWAWAGWATLYIFDCPKLCLTKSFYSIAFSWMIQLLKVPTPYPDLHYAEIVIPGAQIPRWFSQQNVGSSILIDSSPIMRNQNWIGVACCVTFVTHDDPTSLIDPGVPWIIWCCFLKPSVGILSGRLIPITFRKDLVTVEFDHLALLYFPREEFIDKNDFEGVQFVSTTVECQPLGLHVEVKMCGYKWIFEEDLEQLIHSMEHSGKSSVLKGNFLTNESPDELYHGKAA